MPSQLVSASLQIERQAEGQGVVVGLERGGAVRDGAAETVLQGGLQAEAVHVYAARSEVGRQVYPA